MHGAITVLPVLGQIVDPGFFVISILLAPLLLAAWFTGVVAPMVLLHFLFTLPMRRAERARLFLDLVEDALKRGQSIEQMILSLARDRDRTVGMHFHLVAAYLESGVGFNQALDLAPQFLPPQIAAMLRAGQNLGDVRRVLPACREILRDGPAGVRSAVHYMLLVILFFSPVFVGIVSLESVYVIPRFQDVAAGMDITVWPLTAFVFAHTGWLMGFDVAVFAALIFVTALYIGGPRFARFFQLRGFPLADWIAWHISWKRKRLQRTFSAMLAVLLDGGVPEAEAARLAGDCTANEICRARAGRVVAALQQGIKMEDAVRAFDHKGEFHWRLSNAAHARGGFATALRGWHETLDAKAFQQEEATAHTVTTGIVILNGVLVGLIATAMFGILIAVLRWQLSQ